MQIRNFAIIAHIDHGKTTLTDRFLLTTGALEKRVFQERMLDSSGIERKRGVTISLAPVRMQWQHPDTGELVQLNLIDTPGHVDFGYEVSRSLAACEGVILVVDATQGVQAQTLANYDKAKALNLKIIPVINKIDLPAADPDSVTLELMETLGFAEDEVVRVSAKSGEGVPQLLDALVRRLPEPGGNPDLPLQALVFTAQYDSHQGVIAYVRVMNGVLKPEPLLLKAENQKITPTDIGVFSPHRSPVKQLAAGEVGYVATGLKTIAAVPVGDTIVRASAATAPALPGYAPPQPMVYQDIYPIDGDDFHQLTDSLHKLQLHDAAVVATGVHSPALGNGYRCGFLGVFHAEIVRERLLEEFGLNLVATAPSVPYTVELRSGEPVVIHHASELPDMAMVTSIAEPMTHATLFAPRMFLGGVLQLLESHRGSLLSLNDIGGRIRLEAKVPLAELIISFHDELKSISQGFASLEYHLVGEEKVDVVKLSILVAGESVEALSHMVVREQLDRTAKGAVKKLKEVIPPQQFEVAIQAAVGGKIIARETLRAYRKDVTAKLYGGDRTRRMKLLEKQKAGKQRMKSIGRVQLPSEAFLAVLAKSD